MHRRARRRRIDHVPCVDGVHGRELTHVREEHRRPNDVREVGARSLEQRADVAHDLIGLCRDVAVDQPASRGIEADLSGDEEEVARADRGAVWTDRFRRIGRRNRLPHLGRLGNFARTQAPGAHPDAFGRAVDERPH